MKTKRVLSGKGAALALVIAVNVTGGAGLVRDAEAVVGVPVSPVSVAGVARRTAVRTTVAVSASSQQAAAASQQQAQVAQQQAQVAQQQAQVAQQQAATAQAQAAAAKLPVGTVVSALPQGCTSTQISGASYFNCGGTYYKPSFQSNNVVYIVAQP
jgi:type II secretory pathway pseudopilin PulG